MSQTRSTSWQTASISIVAPCYNEEAVLPEFYHRISEAVRSTRIHDFEIILVDDGSSDRTWNHIADFAEKDPRIIGVRLMRNHGHQAAVTAGLELSRGERVLLIDADLQDPPELLVPMMTLMDEGADVVFGQRLRREGETWFKKASASLFYRFLVRITAVQIPSDTGDFRLMNRRVVDALSAMPERQRFIRGMVSWIGGKQVALPYERQKRYAGSSKYPLRKMVRFAIDAITSFSTIPLRAASYVGVGAAIIGFMLLIYTALRWLADDTVAGWSSLMTAIVMFGAIQLIVLGIVGEYMARLFQEAKARPLFLIDHIIADGKERALPMEFCNLNPNVRRDLWDAAREVEVQRQHKSDMLS